MSVSRVGTDDENHIRLHHRIKILRARGFTQGLLEAVTRGGVADARAGIDVVVTEAGANQLLDEIGFLVAAPGRGDATDRVAAILCLDPLEFAGRMADGVLPGNLAPRVADVGPDHGLQDAVPVSGITDCEPALYAGVAMVGMAVLVGDHAHNFLALHFGAERATHTTIGAGRHHTVLGLACIDQTLFRQSRGRARLYAGAARNALGVHERLVLTRRDLGIKTAALDGEGESTLLLFAGTDAT